tara:strand:+ start:668 stop:1501 length:834 start_codon:yes stop_codon:yes gene_type:complete
MINYLNLTFIIVTFKSEHIISDCLKDIPKECKKIIIENSGNTQFYESLKNKIPNLKVFIMNNNNGFGKANNFGILNSNTEYLFLINPDTKIYKSEIDEMIKIIQNVDFAIAAPQVIEKFKVYKQNKANRDYISVNEVRGMAMLLNKKKFSGSFFDENFFLYLEEIDLCKRVKNMGEKIIEVNVEVSHLGNQSHSDNSFEIEMSRNWHWMWSKFYFSKKYKGFTLSIIIFFPTFIKLLIKLIFYFMLRNNTKFIINKMRLKGLLTSIIGKSSYYRPKI